MNNEKLIIHYPLFIINYYVLVFCLYPLMIFN